MADRSPLVSNASTSFLSGDDLSAFSREDLIAKYEDLAENYERLRSDQQTLKKQRRSLEEALRLTLKNQEELEGILAARPKVVSSE
jgi:hypothetical protein